MAPWLLLFGILGILCGYWWGHSSAHLEVAHECRLMGQFYVGSTVFKCTEIIEKPFRLVPPPRPRHESESPAQTPGA